MFTAGLLAAGLAAFAATPASALAARAGDGWIGGRWDGGHATYDGRDYGWPTGTYDFVGDVCPDMDTARTNPTGDPETVELVAPAGQLISAYCIKAGSDNNGEGPKIVTLDQPVASLTIAYPVGGRCKSISHYAVTYVDAATAEPTTIEEVAEEADVDVVVASPAPSASPSIDTTIVTDAAPGPEVSSPAPSPLAQVADAADTVADDAPLTVLAAPASPSAAPSPSASLVAVDDAELTSSLVTASQDGASRAQAVNTAAADGLPVTGAQVTVTVIVALALTALGTAAIVFARRRRATTAG